MKKHLQIVAAALFSLTLISASAQPRAGGMGALHGPQLSGSMAKLFGDNSAFTATMEMQVGSADHPMNMPGKIAFSDGKSRFEMDMLKMNGTKMSPEQAAQMKAMGMDSMVIISLPDKKVTELIYPGLQSYAEMPLQEADSETSTNDFKIETTEIGKETVEGHPTIKNKVIMTDSKGTKHEATTWNATDLKKFPVKIEQTEQGKKITMLFKDVKLAKPDDSAFAAPAGFKKYDSIQAMMQEVMMKRFNPGAGVPKP